MTKYAWILMGAILTVAFGGCSSDKPTGGGSADSLAVNVVFPTDGAVIHGPTALQANVTGSSGGTKVKFIIDSAPVATDSTAPWEYIWDPTALPNGSSHTFRVIATDVGGHADTSALRTMYANYAKLILAVQSPSNGAVIPTAQAFQTTVTGGAGGTVVNFIIDGAVAASDSAAPFQYSWNPSALPSGSAHTVRMAAADTAGQVDSSTVRTVYARFAPLVMSLPFPPNDAVLGETRSFDVSVTGGSGGFHVRYYVDGGLALDDSIAPFGLSWNPTLVPLGSSHTVHAICTDSSGQADTTSQRQIWALWRQVVTGSGTALPLNIRKLFARSTDQEIEFRVEFDHNWLNYKSYSSGIICALFFDTDQSKFTGRNIVVSNLDTIPIGDIGAEYRSIVGFFGDSIWTWSGSSSSWSLAHTFRTLKVASPSNFFEFAVWPSDIGNSAAFDFVASNAYSPDQTGLSYIFDWVPSSGHASYTVDQKYFGPPIAVPPGNPFISR